LKEEEEEVDDGVDIDNIGTGGRWISSPIMVVARTTAGGVFASALHAVQVWGGVSGIALGIPVAVCVPDVLFGRR
jgi:hypothetical protein